MLGSRLRSRYLAFGVWSVVGFAAALAVAMTVKATGPQVDAERARHARRMGWDALSYQSAFTLMERAEKDKTLSNEDWKSLKSLLARGETPIRVEALAVLPLLRKGDLAESARMEALRYLDDREPAVRAHALESLYFMRDPSWKIAAKRLASDTSAEVRKMIELLSGHERDHGKKGS